VSHADTLKFETLVAALGAMPEDHLDALASELMRSERTLDETQRDQLVSYVPDIWRVHTGELIDSWRRGNGPSSGVDLSLMVRTVGRAYRVAEANEVVQLAWTGPDHLQSTFRRTDRAWVEVIAEATRTLWIASYATWPGDEINNAIELAIGNSVQVNIIVERPEDNTGLTNTGLNRFTQMVRSTAQFFAWPKEERPTNESNHCPSMHAKCVIADKRVAFVTSANLTEAAMERNIEVGIVLRGGPQPGRLVERFESMVTSGDLRQFSP
jgi:phosphatidylserine/phosphatidylglycerophosphate/cardiolipin synthase-like enzyme